MLPRSRPQPTTPVSHPLQRIRWWYGVLLLLAGVFIVRLFYLQVIRHDYYQKAAFRSQLKQYEIPAERGVISAHDGSKIMPLVLNETLYTLYADPTYVKDAHAAAESIQKAIGGDASNYERLMKTPDTRYVILAKKLSADQSKKITGLTIKGVGTRDYQYRTYPNGSLAAQVLGFVNDDGQGTYGIEQALNNDLSGKPGTLKAITDAQGVPLPANKDNTIVDPTAGKNVVLTIDLGLQQQMEDILKGEVTSTQSSSGSAIIMEANTGAIKAMANYPTYDPGQYQKVSDANLYNNTSVTMPLEVGSIMKALTSAAALDQGVVTTATTYYDPSHWTVDGATIKNVEEDGGAGTKSVQSILSLSLNTGATWLLMQMGGGQINQKARLAWNDYMLNHYQLGRVTGIEQGFEDPGYIPSPTTGYGLNLTYANTAFGQGMTATPLQMVSAFAAVVNGGTYYQPHLIDREISADNKVVVKEPKTVRSGVVKPDISATMQNLLEYTLQVNAPVYGAGTLPLSTYGIGGKTGTAQISKPTGGYYDDRYNGTYLGFVGGNKPQYVIVVRMSEPKHITGYAGAKAAAPVFVRLAQALINSYDVQPKQ
jgi:cell division protein FtsI/penicillin-binding protein 2